jgi:DNA-binding NarL/FixJ family response regulator
VKAPKKIPLTSQIATLLHEGLQNNEIADRLFVSPKTVEHHISAILSKLEVNSRSKAVLQAQKLGIFTPKK